MKSKALRPWFELVAITEDEATNQFFANIRFRDVDGGVRNAFVPLADLDNRRILAKTLQNLGAYFSGKHQVNEDALGKLVASKHKAKRLNFAARVGWYDGYRAFVLPNRVIGIPFRRAHSSAAAQLSWSCRRPWTPSRAARSRVSGFVPWHEAAVRKCPLLRRLRG